MIPFFEHKSSLLQSRRELENLNFPLHLHLCPEFLYLRKGEMDILYRKKSYRLQGGDFAVVFPGSVHGYTTLSQPEKTDYSIAIWQIPAFFEFQDILITNHPSPPVICKGTLPKDVPRLMEELAKLSSRPEELPLIRAIIQLICARTLPLLNLKKNSQAFQSDITVRMITFATQNYRESLTLDRMAKDLGVSRFVVSRLFNETMDMGFSKYLNHLRTEYAKDRLLNTTDTILQIALDSGFENLRNFNRVFKNITNTTPLMFRKTRYSEKSSAFLKF